MRMLKIRPFSVVLVPLTEHPMPKPLDGLIVQASCLFFDEYEPFWKSAA